MGSAPYSERSPDRGSVVPEPGLISVPRLRTKIWWRRRELNPRPKSTNQPRLHAYPGEGFLLCDAVQARFALPSPHEIFSVNNARSPLSTMPAMAFIQLSRCLPANVVALGREG